MTTMTLPLDIPVRRRPRGPVLMRVRETVRTWRTRARERARLAELPPALLDDIGLTREAAEAEARKPFWQA